MNTSVTIGKIIGVGLIIYIALFVYLLLCLLGVVFHCDVIEDDGSGEGNNTDGNSVANRVVQLTQRVVCPAFFLARQRFYLFDP